MVMEYMKLMQKPGAVLDMCRVMDICHIYIKQMQSYTVLGNTDIFHRLKKNNIFSQL